MNHVCEYCGILSVNMRIDSIGDVTILIINFLNLVCDLFMVKILLIFIILWTLECNYCVTVYQLQ
jgi:hypothetical protein